MKRYITVNASVDVNELVSELDDNELAELGLHKKEKATTPVGLRLRALANAVNGGNEALRDEIIKELCWDEAGVMAYPPIKVGAPS